MKYIKPDFDVTVYEVEDVITLSFDSNEPDAPGTNDTGWFG